MLPHINGLILKQILGKMEIDLNNHLVIQVPTGQKEALANIVAIENGYSATVTTIERKEYLGTALELDTFIVGKPDNIRILNRLSDRILYEETITSANPVSMFEHGIEVIRLHIGVKVREAVTSYNTKVLKAQQETDLQSAEDVIKADLDASLTDLTAI